MLGVQKQYYSLNYTYDSEQIQKKEQGRVPRKNNTIQIIAQSRER